MHALVKSGRLHSSREPNGTFRFDRSEVEALEADLAAARHRREAERDERVALGVAKHVDSAVAKRQSIFEGSMLEALEKRETAKLSEKLAELKNKVEHLETLQRSRDQQRSYDHEDVETLTEKVEALNGWLKLLGGAVAGVVGFDPRFQAWLADMLAPATPPPADSSLARKIAAQIAAEGDSHA